LILGQKVYLDLARQDYAIRIDPQNVDKTGSYIGCSIDFKSNVIKVLSIPVKLNGKTYSNARVNNSMFTEAIVNAKVDGLTIGYSLNKAFEKEQFVNNAVDANVIISRKSKEELGIENAEVTLLHPGRNQEQINNMLF